jgi:hypothetical protein
MLVWVGVFSTLPIIHRNEDASDGLYSVTVGRGMLVGTLPVVPEVSQKVSLPSVLLTI